MVFNGHDVIISCDRGLQPTGEGKISCVDGKFPVLEEPIECKQKSLIFLLSSLIKPQNVTNIEKTA